MLPGLTTPACLRRPLASCCALLLSLLMACGLAGCSGVGQPPQRVLLSALALQIDLTQRSTRNRSAEFAQVLLENIADETTLLRRSHRDANLMVLLAPDVPAVLLEMGFINNPDDERQLSDSAHRKRLMTAVGDAVDAWFARQAKVAGR